LPERCVAVYEDWKKGRHAEALAPPAATGAGIQDHRQRERIAGLKYAMDLRGYSGRSATALTAAFPTKRNSKFTN
jgi:hypothetical protein